MEKKSLLESLLFVANKPLGYKELAKYLEIKESELKELLNTIKERFNKSDSGIHLTVNNSKVQLTTNPANAKPLNDYFKAELSGDLTKPSLETLTIIAYRQPITKEELEQIRGVNCSLILRNLLIRGLVESKESDLTTIYSVTMDFVRHLGLNSVEDLPNYQKLNSDESLDSLLKANQDGNTTDN